MAGRGMLFADGPSACPFVALETDRDRRAAEPDPRHRCYAEPVPAARALAHQREFCLTPGFTGCPIFQDWAVRAAARPVPLRPLGPTADDVAPSSSEPEQLPAFGGLAAPGPQAPTGDAIAPPAIPPPAIPPPVVPPPVASAADRDAAGRSLDPQPIERIPSLPLESGTDEPKQAQRGEPDDNPAGDRAPTRTGSTQPPSSATSAPPGEPAQSGAGTRPRWTDDWPPSASAGQRPEPPAAHRPEPAAPPLLLAGRSQIEVGRPIRPRRPPDEARSAQRRPDARPPARDEWSAQRADLIPSWQRERYAAYPGLRARIGLGDGDLLLSRITRILGIIAIGALVIALLILAPGFFAGGPVVSPTPAVSPSPTGPTPTPSPTITPEPTISFRTYVVQAGDSLSAIAVEFGLLPCQIQAANPSITDPNTIFIGQVIQIPPDDFALDCAATPPPASP